MTPGTEERYRVLLQLGEGGMGRVLLAAHSIEGLQKLVVLKCMRDELAGDEEVKAALVQEARLLARMNHPNVVQILDVHSGEGAPVIAMEYLEGQPLIELRKDSAKRLPLGLELLVLVEVLKGLEYFHTLTGEDGSPLNPVHRDVSPHNVFITYEGCVKVLDFGIARANDTRKDATSTGILKGKLRYMAPEQLMQEAVDQRTDLFAVGIMLWEAVTGLPLWPGSDGTIMRGLVNGEWPSSREVAPLAPEVLHRVVESVLTLEPNDRLGTAAELREKLVLAIRELDDKPSLDDLATFMKRTFQSELTDRRRRVAQRLHTDRELWSSQPPPIRALAFGHDPSPRRGPLVEAEPPRTAPRVVKGLLGAAITLGIAAFALRFWPSSHGPESHTATPILASAKKSDTTAPLAPSSSGEAPPPFPPCAAPNIIADFEGGNPSVCTTGIRGGTFFFWFDGTGTLNPGAGIVVRSHPLPEPRKASQFALHITGTGQTLYGAGLSARLANLKPYDVSGYEGIALWIYSPHAITLDFKVATVQTLSSNFGGACEPTREADCDDHYGARYSAGPHWKFFRIPFRSLKQLEHGVRAPFDPRQALEFQVRIPKLTAEPLSFDLWVDDIMFY